MPDPRSRHAPDYDMDYPDELEDFLEEFEGLARKYRLTSREKSKVVVKYVGRKTGVVWKDLKGYDEDYELMRRKIMQKTVWPDEAQYMIITQSAKFDGYKGMDPSEITQF